VSPVSVVYASAHVPLSALTSQLEQVVEDELEQTPSEQVPPSHELPHSPQSVLEVGRYWQPSEHIV
jgi:hypothetical protein